MTGRNTDMPISRRSLFAALAAGASGEALGRESLRGVELIEAPSNLGLRPLRPGHIPGAWRAPEALRQAGFHARVQASGVYALPRPRYELEPQPGTRIRNGNTIRRYSHDLAQIVSAVLSRAHAPIVLGGDCSILLGCLLGARALGRCGLLHVDGHSDFFHPGNYDASQRLGSAAGMDLALATGRGEALLTQWPGVAGPLVEDGDVVQIGERDELDADYAYRDIEDTEIRRLTMRHVKRIGVAQAVEEAAAHLLQRSLDRVWLHIDVDVLDENVMPAVDSLGSPGFDFDELEAVIQSVCRTMPVAGVDITIFDPDLDPQGGCAVALARSLANGIDRL